MRVHEAQLAQIELKFVPSVSTPHTTMGGGRGNGAIKKASKTANFDELARMALATIHHKIADKKKNIELPRILYRSLKKLEVPYLFFQFSLR